MQFKTEFTMFWASCDALTTAESEKEITVSQHISNTQLLLVNMTIHLVYSAGHQVWWLHLLLTFSFLSLWSLLFLCQVLLTIQASRTVSYKPPIYHLLCNIQQNRFIFPYLARSQTSLIHNKGIWAVFLVIGDMFQDVIHVNFKSSDTKQLIVE